jgi:hypothetical protein
MGAISESLGEECPGDLQTFLWGPLLKCKRMSPGQNSKQYLEVFGLKACRDLELQGGEALLLY